MKRILCTILALCLLLPTLFSCGSDPASTEGTTVTTKDDTVTTAPPADTTTVRVGLLSGTTGMGAAKMRKDGDPRYHFTPYSVPDALLSDLIAGRVDLATLPTNAAAKLYNKTGGNIRMLALNTLGVLHVLDRTGSIHSLDDLAGKTVYVPMAGQNPEYIFRHILEKNGLTGSVTVKTDISDADALASALLADSGEYADVQIIVLPEPKVTVTEMQAKQKGISCTDAIDLTVEWNKVESAPIPQGCLVARKDFLEAHPAAVNEFLAAYKDSIEYMTAPENLEAAAALLVEFEIIPKAPIAKAALPECSIAYLDGQEMKDSLTAFYAILYGFDPKSVGNTLPGNDFYYLP